MQHKHAHPTTPVLHHIHTYLKTLLVPLQFQQFQDEGCVGTLVYKDFLAVGYLADLTGRERVCGRGNAIDSVGPINLCV